MASSLKSTSLLWIVIHLSIPAYTGPTQAGKVLVLAAECAIQPACADYIREGIEAAEGQDAEFVVIKLNTPGGLLKSTRVIVTEILEADVPVGVYVSPSGAQAASAGVFITLAGHIAAMAPGTNIGAAHPVSMQGQADSTMIEKATNDAAAFIRSISGERKRNVEWAEDAVRKSLSITETEALDKNVIDVVAKDVRELLEQIDGREVDVDNEMIVLHTADAEIVPYDMTFAQKLLSILSDPNLAYILLILGLYGIIFELYSPGAIFPGVIGGISLILAFYSMHTLPVNYAGLALIIFAIILFILEIKVVSQGILTIGGVLSLLLGSLMLMDEGPFLDVMQISIELIILVVVLTAAFFLFAITFAIKAHKNKITTGKEGIVGEKGITMSALKPLGEVKVHGEIWRAKSVDGNIKKGIEVEVVGVENLRLEVKKA